MARVTGIGGISFKARQTASLAGWYRARPFARIVDPEGQESALRESVDSDEEPYLP